MKTIILSDPRGSRTEIEAPDWMVPDVKVYTDRRDFVDACQVAKHEKNLTIVGLGKEAGISENMIRLYLSKRCRIPDGKAQALADILGLQVRLPLEH